tara:strand:- start:689 stop:1006 length:318 start_codon:yes stop_codon:yes gene_type:complete
MRPYVAVCAIHQPGVSSAAATVIVGVIHMPSPPSVTEIDETRPLAFIAAVSTAPLPPPPERITSGAQVYPSPEDVTVIEVTAPPDTLAVADATALGVVIAGVGGA